MEAKGGGANLGIPGGRASLHPSLSPEEVSLPPEVEGKQRGSLVFRLGPLAITSDSAKPGAPETSPATTTTLSFRFWGQEDLQEGNYVGLVPCAADQALEGDAMTLVIPIRCSPTNFTRYLKDSQPLQVTVFVPKIGPVTAEVDLGELELKKPLRENFNLTDPKT